MEFLTANSQVNTHMKSNVREEDRQILRDILKDYDPTLTDEQYTGMALGLKILFLNVYLDMIKERCSETRFPFELEEIKSTEEEIESVREELRENETRLRRAGLWME